MTTVRKTGAAVLLALCGCHHDAASPADAAGDHTSLPPCATAAGLYTVTIDNTKQVVRDGSSLGIVLGFQGFQFASIGVTTSDALPPVTAVEISVLVPGKVDRTTRNGDIVTTPGAAGWETETVLVFFNDAPLAELIGAEGTLTLRANGTSCVATASARVVLASGGFQGRDAGTDPLGDGSSDAD